MSGPWGECAFCGMPLSANGGREEYSVLVIDEEDPERDYEVEFCSEQCMADARGPGVTLDDLERAAAGDTAGDR